MHLKITHYRGIIFANKIKEITIMSNFFNNIVSSIGITDILDILIVAFIVYKVLGFIRETRAEQLAKGLLVLVVGTLLSDICHLYT